MIKTQKLFKYLCGSSNFGEDFNKQSILKREFCCGLTILISQRLRLD